MATFTAAGGNVATAREIFSGDEETFLIREDSGVSRVVAVFQTFQLASDAADALNGV